MRNRLLILRFSIFLAYCLFYLILNLELADQPANIIPNTPIPDINNIYNVLYPISSIIIPLLNGITPHDIIPHTNVTYGANKNNTLFPCETNIVSFITNFNPSATLLNDYIKAKISFESYTFSY